MSAECPIHGVDLLGFMDSAFCPLCRIEELLHSEGLLLGRTVVMAMALREAKELIEYMKKEHYRYHSFCSTMNPKAGDDLLIEIQELLGDQASAKEGGNETQ